MNKGFRGESERHAMCARGQRTSIGTQLKQLQNKQKNIENKRLQLLENYIITNVPWTKGLLHIVQHKDGFDIDIYSAGHFED
jgi:hypothetical protein